MLADHGGAMDALGWYCGIRLSPSTMRFASRSVTFAKDRRRVTDGSEDEVVGGLAGLSWKELVGTGGRTRLKETPLWIARFNY
jgi:hypothetical protein